MSAENATRDHLQLLTEQAQLRAQMIRRRAEWIDAARLRLWERLDRQGQPRAAAAHAAAE